MFRRLYSSAVSYIAPSLPKPRTMSTGPLKKPCKFALIQLATGPDKPSNLKNAAAKVTEAAKSGADIVVLPECFNSPYGTKHFPGYAEPIPQSHESATDEEHPSYTTLQKLAKDLHIHLIAGSIPEVDPATKKLYNTCMIFDRDGKLLATHRKTHLFDIDIPGKISFHESEVLTAGDSLTLVDLPPFGLVGIGICYDVRFPELAMIAARKGAFAMVYPGAFNMTTGPMHWELLARARAVDNQVWVAMCSPARAEDAEYVAWGHSMVVDPSAVVVGQLEAEEGVLEVEVAPERIQEVRKGIPVGSQRRFDVYADVSVAGPTEGK